MIAYHVSPAAYRGIRRGIIAAAPTGQLPLQAKAFVGHIQGYAFGEAQALPEGAATAHGI